MDNINKKYITKQELDEWYTLCIQYINGYHMEKYEKLELLRLNHRVMEACHNIHNDNMLDKI